jgi:hypothetical protein
MAAHVDVPAQVFFVVGFVFVVQMSLQSGQKYVPSQRVGRDKADCPF